MSFAAGYAATAVLRELARSAQHWQGNSEIKCSASCQEFINLWHGIGGSTVSQKTISCAKDGCPICCTVQGKLAPCGHCKERIKNLLNDESVGENEGGALSVDVTQVKVAKKKKKQPQQHRPRRSESTSPTLSEPGHSLLDTSVSASGFRIVCDDEKSGIRAVTSTLFLVPNVGIQIEVGRPLAVDALRLPKSTPEGARLVRLVSTVGCACKNGLATFSLPSLPPNVASL